MRLPPYIITALAIYGLIWAWQWAEAAVERMENQIVITEGSLKEYKAAKKRAAAIDGCFGWDDKAKKYKVWTWNSQECQN